MKSALPIACALLAMTVGGEQKVVEEEAITLSGQRVILYKDGTWAYREAKPQKEVLFRGVPWGVNKAAVKKAMEDYPLRATDDALVYSDTIAGLPVHCVFIFAKDRFVRAKYIFMARHSDDNVFFKDYEAVNTLLMGKYGKVAPYLAWSSGSAPEEDRSLWAEAVATGDLRVSTHWKVGDTTIGHYLYGDNVSITHAVEYVHSSMATLEKSLRDEADKGKL